MQAILANFGNIFGIDGIVLFSLGLLIFGRRLPEMVRNLALAARYARSEPDSVILVAFCVYMVVLIASYLAAHGGP